MKTTRLHLALSSSIVLAAVFGAGHPVGAEVRPRFQVLDLTELGFIPNPDAHGTVAINNNGQVAYSHMVNDQMHGWVFLPTAAFGQPEGLLDLVVLGGADGESAAWDLNMSGVVVGQVNGSQLGQGEAVAWQLAATVTACPLGFLAGNQNDLWSVAYAVNDADPPVIVGDSSLDDSSICFFLNAPFRVPFDGTCPAPDLELLAAFDTDDRGRYARDINTPANPPYQSQIVGFSGLELGACSEEDCAVTADALRWLNGAVAALIRLPDGGGHEARGTNNDANIVGLGFDDTEQTVCLTRALFWLNDAANPVNLHLEGQTDPTQQTRAEAINNRDPLQVVGRNITTGRALLWEQDGAGGWDPVITLNDKIDPNSGWILRAGHDANDAGCIVGWGLLEVQPNVFEPHAFLLYECPADLDGNAVVGITDLLALLAAFGPCPAPPDPCPADLNGDGTVDTLDMLQLLANWGACCAGRNTSPPQTVQDCIDKFCCEYANQLALERCLCAVDPQSCE